MLTPTTCKGCGAPLEPDALFCPRCGTQTGRAREAVAPTALPVAPTRVGPSTPVASGELVPATRVATDPMIGREVIGQYVIRAKLGEGGMGSVYIADQPSVGRQAVVKVMHPELSRDPSVAPRFEIEARAASLLNHPHIVTIYNYGAMEDGTLFLAMEHCAGPSLDKVLQEGPLSSERTARIGAQICDALAEAHRRGVVHRDLKPSNLILTDVGRQHDFVKVLDFGIAKVEGVRMTRTGTFVGTPQYMSPEQFRGEKPDGRADLYSLGVMLFEMVTGRSLFESDGAAGYMHKHLSEQPVPPRVIVPELSVAPALEAAILRSLAKERDGRFTDADEMGRALEACLAAPQAVSPLTAPERPRSSRRVGLAAAAAAVVAAGGVALVFTLRDGGTPQLPSPGSAPTGVAWQTTHDSRLPSAHESVRAARPAAADAALPQVAAKVGDVPRPQRARPRVARNVAGARVASRGEGREGRGNMVTVAAPPTEAASGGQAAPVGGQADPVGIPRVAGPRPAGKEGIAELRRVMSTAKVPASTYDNTLQEYNGLAEAKRPEYLAQILATYRRPGLQFSAKERQPLEKLKQLFLSMEAKGGLTVEERSRVYDSTVGEVDKNSGYPVKDRPFYKRMAILNLIRTYASDPSTVLR